MFDFGWQEFMMIAFVLVLVVGPKDLPKVLRGFSKITGQARQMAREFTRSLEDVTADSDMKEVKSMVADLKSGNLEDMARIVDDTVKPELDSASKDGSLSGLREDIEAVKSAGREETAAEADKASQDKA
ncbi:MAG TPA: twin-arginine translocase subunit TatB [Alphaproteobacteria bacterium]|nr:twin-arginine translocase subunit TatB [Alphaproteobacteria bacterium]